ncbi:MAG TPA: hypothetical protein VGD64_15120 [Acidisarcina sp.]
MNNKWNAAILCSALSVTISGTVSQVFAQSADSEAKPSPYVGVSQPPPDDTIVSSPDAPPPVVRPVAPAASTAPDPSYSQPSSPQSTPVLIHRPRNPDAGIVTVPVDATQASQASYAGSTHSRSLNPDSDIVTFVPTRPGELPAGTNIHVRLSEQLSSTETRAGSAFKGQVAKDVMLSGRVVIPQGSELRGRVESVREGHRFANHATIRLRPDAVILPDGSQYSLHAAVVGAHNRNTKVDGEGGITTKSHLKKDTVEEGLGAGTGAIAGAAMGGPPGALIGTLVGVGVVTTHLIVQHPQPVDMPANSTVVFSLTEPLALTPILE